MKSESVRCKEGKNIKEKKHQEVKATTDVVSRARFQAGCARQKKGCFTKRGKKHGRRPLGVKLKLKEGARLLRPIVT